MDFRLTYAGPLYAQNNREGPNKVAHKHALRRHFHQQLKAIWEQHPVLVGYTNLRRDYPNMLHEEKMFEPYHREGFTWQPLVRGGKHGLVCRLHILMLRHGGQGGVLTDIDNRLKTLFDALQLAQRSEDLPKDANGNTIVPAPDETPFYVLLENDHLITAVSVETDTLLEPVRDPANLNKLIPMENAVRLVISTTVRPYNVHMDNMSLV
jgi:hypothetical protein